MHRKGRLAHYTRHIVNQLCKAYITADGCVIHSSRKRNEKHAQFANDGDRDSNGAKARSVSAWCHLFRRQK